MVYMLNSFSHPIKWILGMMITLLCSATAWSHQPDLASIIISKTADGKTILQINSSLTAFQTEINYHYGKAAYSSPEAFRKLVMQHFAKTFSIVANENDSLQFINPLVVLGHETKYVTEIKGLPLSLTSLQINTTFFKEIHNNQAVVALLFADFPAHKNYEINRDTFYQLELAYVDNQWQIVKPMDTQKYLYYSIYILSFVALCLFVYFMVKKKMGKV